jgi:FixJ family two-component response regulator
MTKAVPTVAIIDDDRSVIKGLSRLIQSAGYVVEAFSAGEQFLQELPSSRWSCVIIDVRMPGLTGMDVQKELARRNMTLPYIFITGHGDNLMRSQAIADGAVDVLFKPVNDADLLHAIEKALAP